MVIVLAPRTPASRDIGIQGPLLNKQQQIINHKRSQDVTMPAHLTKTI